MAPDFCRFVLCWLHLQSKFRFFPKAGKEQGAANSMVHIKSPQ